MKPNCKIYILAYGPRYTIYRAQNGFDSYSDFFFFFGSMLAGSGFSSSTTKNAQMANEVRKNTWEATKKGEKNMK